MRGRVVLFSAVVAMSVCAPAWAQASDTDEATTRMGPGASYEVKPNGYYPPILERAMPEYPLLARMFGLRAHCLATYDLTPSGETTDICVTCVAASAHQLFETAVHDAIAQWRYAPEGTHDPRLLRQGLAVDLPFGLGRMEDPQIPPFPTEHVCAGEPIA